MSWIPNHSVGPFIFREKITKYEKYRINYYSLYSRVTPFMGYYWFKSFEELYIFHSSDQNDNRLIIDSIHSTKLYYKGQNLLKMNIQDVFRLLGKPNTIDGMDMPDNTYQTVYDFDQFCAQIYTISDIVVNVITWKGE